jgi:hypothetical protein
VRLWKDDIASVMEKRKKQPHEDERRERKENIIERDLPET